MKKFYQKESYPTGDCFRTCVASILEVDSLEDVPNFMRDGEKKFDEYFKTWLNNNGFICIQYMIQESKVINRVGFDGALCILGGINTATGIHHSCVGQIRFEDNCKLYYDCIHDPLKNNDIENMSFISAYFIVKRIDGLMLNQSIEDTVVEKGLIDELDEKYFKIASERINKPKDTLF